MTPDRYLTRADAAAVCGVSVATIKRRHHAGAFPGARQRPDDSWEVPLSDLVRARLYDAPAPPPDPPARGEALITELRGEVAAAEARNALLTDQLAAQRDEIRFLRSALKDALGRGVV